MAKPWKIPYLNLDDSLKSCVEKILRTRYREMFSYERGTMEGVDIEALHNMRVSSRRLHAVMKIFRDCFPGKKFDRHYKKIRGLIQSLGGVRDFDVFIDMLEKHKQTVSPEDRKAIDLLIARQKHFRLQERMKLLQVLKVFRDEHYEQKFMRFLTESLEQN